MPSIYEKKRLIQAKTTLKQLITVCPELWQETGEEINRRLAAARPGSRDQASISPAGSASLNEYIKDLNRKAEAWSQPLIKSRFNLGMVERAFADIVRSRMAWLALQNYYLAALGGHEGKVRFGLWSGTILQRLLFRKGFERKPVSLFWYGLGWPLVTQKKILMRLVYKKGIYCFYSKALIQALTGLIAQDGSKGPALEIAAGDGTLSRFLRAAGLETVATDDLSWEATAKTVKAAATTDIIAMDANQAVKKFQPAVVICSWPPAGNQFERQVLASKATQLYIVIGSRHHFASGNWDSYLEWAQPVIPTREAGSTNPQGPLPPDPRPFTMELDEGLSRLVLPRELDNAVLIFRRKV